jgi:hypothetical protein
MLADLRTVQSSGDRYFEIVNATGCIRDSFQMLDSSTTHVFTVEIYKDGKLLMQGSVSKRYGTVTLSADAITGAVQSGNGTAGITAAMTTVAAAQTITKTS